MQIFFFQFSHIPSFRQTCLIYYFFVFNFLFNKKKVLLNLALLVFIHATYNSIAAIIVQHTLRDNQILLLCKKISLVFRQAESEQNVLFCEKKAPRRISHLLSTPFFVKNTTLQNVTLCLVADRGLPDRY